MATNTDQLTRKDNTALWTIIGLIVVAVLAYVAYAAYHGNSSTQPGSAAINGTTNDTRNQTNNR
ncbi:MAG: hypothetical protein JO089_06255 [Alphaproteobacteria bacterium]|nr:hypothetical protein [Alphaproteobacteria bacterium]